MHFKITTETEKPNHAGNKASSSSCLQTAKHLQANTVFTAITSFADNDGENGKLGLQNKNYPVEPQASPQASLLTRVYCTEIHRHQNNP
jgi:hypothetical protein